MYGVEQELRDPRLLHIDEVRLEQAFRRFEPLATHAYDASIRKCVGLNENCGVFAEPLVEREVVGDVAKLFFDLADRFEVRCPIERISSP